MRNRYVIRETVVNELTWAFGGVSPCEDVITRLQSRLSLSQNDSSSSKYLTTPHMTFPLGKKCNLWNQVDLAFCIS